MDGILNFIDFFVENWSMLATFLAVLIAFAVRVRTWLKKDKQARIDSAVKAVRNSMLSLVASAEDQYGHGTGAIKRSQVLEKIYERYPVLANANLETELDNMIYDALVDLREVLEKEEKAAIADE